MFLQRPVDLYPFRKSARPSSLTAILQPTFAVTGSFPLTIFLFWCLLYFFFFLLPHVPTKDDTTHGIASCGTGNLESTLPLSASPSRSGNLVPSPWRWRPGLFLPGRPPFYYYQPRIRTVDPGEFPPLVVQYCLLEIRF
ncbi:hypothetical protein VTN49DRAFT_6814 [Thermomyces lanuginosus]|uniref:uncharacterized protein n=1 Tax=Thermomyces lanuginosus TaxID=5541 RepID=UPI003742D088